MDNSLYDEIFRRKSIRHYNMTPLGNDQLEEIKDFADKLEPLFKSIRVEYEIAGDVKNIMPVRAPHYFIIYSEKKEGYLMNLGFMFQQLCLFLSGRGLGSCWLGTARPTEKMNTGLEFVIAIAFGTPAGIPYREISEFRRKPLAEISSGNDDRLECAHLAPSAVNFQNWFFACENGKIYVYKKKPNIVQILLYDKMSWLDMGIALCHLCLATQKQGKQFIFSKDSKAGELKGYDYIGSVE